MLEYGKRMAGNQFAGFFILKPLREVPSTRSIQSVPDAALAASFVILFYILAVNAVTSGTVMFVCDR
jgi:hypothetical protein